MKKLSLILISALLFVAVFLLLDTTPALAGPATCPPGQESCNTYHKVTPGKGCTEAEFPENAVPGGWNSGGCPDDEEEIIDPVTGVVVRTGKTKTETPPPPSFGLCFPMDTAVSVQFDGSRNKIRTFYPDGKYRLFYANLIIELYDAVFKDDNCGFLLIGVELGSRVTQVYEGKAMSDGKLELTNRTGELEGLKTSPVHLGGSEFAFTVGDFQTIRGDWETGAFWIWIENGRDADVRGDYVVYQIPDALMVLSDINLNQSVVLGAGVSPDFTPHDTVTHLLREGPAELQLFSGDRTELPSADKVKVGENWAYTLVRGKVYKYALGDGKDMSQSIGMQISGNGDFGFLSLDVGDSEFGSAFYTLPLNTIQTVFSGT